MHKMWMSTSELWSVFCQCLDQKRECFRIALKYLLCLLPTQTKIFIHNVIMFWRDACTYHASSNRDRAASTPHHDELTNSSHKACKPEKKHNIWLSSHTWCDLWKPVVCCKMQNWVFGLILQLKGEFFPELFKVCLYDDIHIQRYH